MNCQLCQKESDACRAGRLSGDLKTQFEDHLRTCMKCRESYQLQIMAEEIMNNEKEILPDPLLVNRIMAEIESYENSGYKSALSLRRVLKPLLIASSLAAAILLGIFIGNMYKPATVGKTIPVELALFNDSALESIDVLSVE